VCNIHLSVESVWRWWAIIDERTVGGEREREREDCCDGERERDMVLW